MSGWIKLYRDVRSNWVWQNSDYLKWWLDILLEVNHTDTKFVIKSKLYECKRGQKLYSLDTWAKRWKTNKSKARSFLMLLQSDGMIELKNETQTTRLTVCNYDSYQDERNANETETKRISNANETETKSIQECNNDNNEKNENKRVVNKFTAPQLLEVESYFIENGYTKESAIKAFNYYNVANWKDSNGKQVKNWKQKMQSVWFKDENKLKKFNSYDYKKLRGPLS